MESDLECGPYDTSQSSVEYGRELVKRCILKIKTAIEPWSMSTATDQQSKGHQKTTEMQSKCHLESHMLSYGN